MNTEDNTSGERQFWHNVSIDESRGGETLQISEDAKAISATYVDEARNYLAGKEMESDLRIKEIVEGLDTAIGVNNNPEARALRKEFERRYRLEVIE